MRILYLTTMIFCHILLSSFILYSSIASASPVAEQHPSKPAAVAEPPKHVDAIVKPKEEVQQPIQYAAAVAPKVEQQQPQLYKPEVQKIESVPSKDSLVPKSAAKDFKVEPSVEEPKSAVAVQPVQQQQQPAKSTEEKLVARKNEVVPEKKAVVVEPVAQPKVYESPKSEAIPSLSDSVQEKLVAESPVVVKQHAAPAVVPAPVKEVKYPVVVAEPAVVAAAPEQAASKPVFSSPPAVKGGLGPLHLLAATLCSYQPHKPVSDETLTYLYSQRAAQRKSLFQFMSLKFTNLDKLTSHLNAGLEPTKSVDSSESSIVRSHGWPVVGNCTAHYLKLMAEAAWCDCVDEPHCLRDVPEVKLHQPRLSRRSVDQQEPITSSVMSKLMYVGDVKDAPVVAEVQKSPAQPATVASTRQCRRNALRLAKALFNHLAENQTEVSESWPKLYSELAHDECARKRMIDIVTALSTFRSESTQVHRDNIEFAFAMDDLRGKVLENEVNTPLTFDKQVIEVEQFLQQSVRLMLANIDPKRAKLTSMRYRSLHAPVSADDQCIELHQRLLAKNYPDECNPNQYGPLPDVLRMAALSLDLWSIEQDLSKYSAPSQQAAPKQQEINECIANLVAN